MSVESYSEVGTKISLAGLHDRYNLRESFVQSPVHLHHHLVRIAVANYSQYTHSIAIIFYL